MTQAPEMIPGAAYAPVTTHLTKDQQAERLSHCDIDPDLYGDQMDITQLATDAIFASEATGWSISGNVHVTQWLRPNGIVPLNETITTLGEITGMDAVPRGRSVASAFRHQRPDGSVPLISERASLQLDPAKQTKSGKAKDQEIDIETLQDLGVKQMTPEKVAGYSNDGKNLIHSDPDVARQYGFRAPIAGGLMGARMILARLAEETGLPFDCDIFIRFRRPMFWDDRLRLMGTRDDQGRLASIHLVNDQDKINVESQIFHDRTA